MANKMEEGGKNNLKITVVGDGFVGKTCILVTYVEGHFPKDYIPTVFENHAKEIIVDGVAYPATLWDTAGQEDYERLRPLTYGQTKCFLLCFAIDSSGSYENVINKWVPELKYYQAETPIVLVGTKVDLRDDPTAVTYSIQDGKRLAKKIHAFAYVECSAKAFQGLNNVFETAIRAASNKTKKSQCLIL